MLDDECLVSSSSSSALTGCDEELDVVFGETTESNSDERQENFTISCLFSFIANNCYWTVTMNMMTIKTLV